MIIAPVYDCGSCLYPQASEDVMKRVLENKAEIDSRVFVFPTSVIQLNGKKINYFDFISSLQNEDCNLALKRILSRIDMDEITLMINDIPCISKVQKKFYVTMLKYRKGTILDYSLRCMKEQ